MLSNKLYESLRICGARVVGGLYLCGEGLALPCDRLPLPMEPCPHCGRDVPFTRSFLWLNSKFLGEHGIPMGGIPSAYNEKTLVSSYGGPDCKCSPRCPVCHPADNIPQGRFALMYVGRDYTPESFIAEAMKLGVSKRLPRNLGEDGLPNLPKEMVLGRTWVMLAYWRYPFQSDVGAGLKSEPVHKPAVFYAFRPTRAEYLLWRRDASSERILELEKKGLTPIIIPDDAVGHAPDASRRIRR